METSSPESRACSNCNNHVQVDPLYWAYKDGKPLGLCLACQTKCKTRQRERELREPIKPAVGTVAKKAKPAAIVKAEVKAVSKLEATNALKAGAVVLNEHAAFVMAKVIEYASDPEHKHHLWALELLAQRILPRKLYEELGGQAAGVGSLNDKRPTFQINILPAVSEAPVGRVVSVQEAEVVESLPAPKEQSE